MTFMMMMKKEKSNLIVSVLLSITSYSQFTNVVNRSSLENEGGGALEDTGRESRAEAEENNMRVRKLKEARSGRKCHFLLQAVREFYGFLDSEDISNCSKLTGDEYL